jgi:hypothetical protein
MIALRALQAADLSGVGTRNPGQIGYRCLPSFVLFKTHGVVRKRAVVANQKSVCLSRSPAYYKDLWIFIACDLKHLLTSHSMNLRKLQRVKFNDCLKFPRPAVAASKRATTRHQPGSVGKAIDNAFADLFDRYPAGNSMAQAAADDGPENRS